MLEHRPVLLLQDVLQVHVLVIAYLADIGVEPWLPGAVANFASELGEVLRLELAAIDPLQPALATYLAQVGSHRLVVDLGPGDQENLGLHAPHVTAPYRSATTFCWVRRRSQRCRLADSRPGWQSPGNVPDCTGATQVQDVADDLVPGPARGGQDRLGVELHPPPAGRVVLDRHHDAVWGGCGHLEPAANLARRRVQAVVPAR